jgi:hypothetical protein
MSIEHAILEICGRYEIDPNLFVEVAYDEPTIKAVILRYSKGEVREDELDYIVNAVF